MPACSQNQYTHSCRLLQSLYEFKTIKPSALPHHGAKQSFPSQGPHHVCSSCGKQRSSAYQKRHPISPEQKLRPGICSRTKCKALKTMLNTGSNQPSVIVLEYHHHCNRNIPVKVAQSPRSMGTELPGDIPVSTSVELPYSPTTIPGFYEHYRSPASERGQEEAPVVPRSTKPFSSLA